MIASVFAQARLKYIVMPVHGRRNAACAFTCDFHESMFVKRLPSSYVLHVSLIAEGESECADHFQVCKMYPKCGVLMNVEVSKHHFLHE